jgi:hypothetical protein
MKSSSSQPLKEIPEVGIRLSNHLSSKSVISMEEKTIEFNDADKKVTSRKKFFKELKKFINSFVKTEHRRLSVFNFVVRLVMWCSCLVTVFNGVKDYLKFDVVSIKVEFLI